MCLHGLSLRLLKGTKNTLVDWGGSLHARGSPRNGGERGLGLGHLNSWGSGHMDLSHNLDFLDHFDFPNDLDLLHDDLGLGLGIGAWKLRGATQRWVRLADVGSVHVDCELGQRVAARVIFHAEALPQRCKGGGEPCCDHLGQAVIEAGQPRLPAAVQVNKGGVLLGLEDPSAQAAEHRVGPHFNEGADALLVHGLDLLHEAHGAGDLTREDLPHGRSLRGVRRRLAVGVDRDLGGGELDSIQELGERRNRCGDDLAVECGSDLQALTGQLSIGQNLLSLLDGFRTTRENNLSWAVVVGQYDCDVLSVQSGHHLLKLRRDCGHGTGNGGSLVHQIAALAGDTQHGGRVEDSGSVKCSHLSIGVTRHSVGLDSKGLQ